MQTLRTWAQNLRSVAKAELVFDPSGLTAIVGPKGSGKTTLAALAPLIAGWGPPGGTNLSTLYRTGGSGDMVAGWEFTTGGHTVTVERRFLRRTSKGVTGVVTKSVSMTVDGQRHDVTADQLTERVSEMTGMTAHQYAATAYVAQGDIDSLVSATPANVEKALIKLTGLTDLTNATERMRTALRPEDKKIAALPGSSEAAQDAQAQACALEAEAAAGTDRAQQARAAADTAQAAQQEAARALDTVTAAARRDDTIDRKRAELDRNTADLAALTAALDPGALSEVPARRTELDARIVAVTAALPVFESAMPQVAAARAVLDAPWDGPTSEAAQAELDTATQAMVTALAAEESLRAALGALQGSNHCPTCRQKLGTDPATFLAGLTAAHTEAEDAYTTAQTEHQRAQQQVAAVRAEADRRDRAQQQHADATARLAVAWESLPADVRTADPADQAAALAALIPELQAQATRLTGQMQVVGAVRAAQATVERTRAELDTLTATDQAAPTPEQLAAARTTLDQATHTASTLAEQAQQAQTAAATAVALAAQARRVADDAAQAWGVKSAALDALAVREAQVSVAKALTRSLVRDFCVTVSAVASAALADLPGEITGLSIDHRYTPEVLLTDGTRRPTTALSGGEKALVGLMLRVGIAAHGTGALPDMLIADEPIAALDEESRIDVLTRLGDMRIPVAIISHTPEVIDLADAVVRLARQPLGTTTVTAAT